MSPVPRKSKPHHQRPAHAAQPAAAALLASAPLITRWTERLLAENDPQLTASQYFALRAIADGPITATDLARGSGVSGPAISQILASLVTAGWVQRREAPTDRRRQDLGLTQTGDAVLARAHDTLVNGLVELIESVPGPELDAVARALPMVQAAVAGTPPPRRRLPPHPPPSGLPHPPPAPGAHPPSVGPFL
jgi:DNA-binding MarR family transcriptional regulator